MTFVDKLPILGGRVSWLVATLLIFASILTFQLVRGIYRITFHPLARFPGPKLTAMTRWVEMYYEVFYGGKGGYFTYKIEEWHQKYGPIVRINPFEVHVDDPDYYDVLFSHDPHLEKRKFAIDNLVHTASSAQHKMRRGALQSFFSKANTDRVEFMIHNGLAKLSAHFEEARVNQTPVDVSLLYRCLMADVISEYAFGESNDFLGNLEWSKGFFEALTNTFKNIFFFRESEIVNYISMATVLLPEWLFSQKEVKLWLEWSDNLRKITDRAMALPMDQYKEKEHRTIFAEYKHNNLPPSEKTNKAIFQVSLMLVGAGLGTPGYTLDVAHFHVMDNPEIYKRLKEELAEAWPDKTATIPAVSVLAQLPFLKAVTKEALRMGLGPMARLQRVNNHSEMVYAGWVIPKGTPIGMSHRFIHNNERLFPDPHTFKPERWMQGEESKALEKYLVTFSRGSRQCLAIQMAYSELYLSLATVFRQFDMELYDTTRLNVDPKYDWFAPFPEKFEERIRVLVK